jgi:hypothetical protein
MGSQSFSCRQISATSIFIWLVNRANICWCLNIMISKTWWGVQGRTYLGHKECSIWGSLIWVNDIQFKSAMSANPVPGSLSQNIQPHCNLLWTLKYFQITKTKYKIVRTISAFIFVWKNEGKIRTPIWRSWSLYYLHNNNNNIHNINIRNKHHHHGPNVSLPSFQRKYLLCSYKHFQQFTTQCDYPQEWESKTVK